MSVEIQAYVRRRQVEEVAKVIRQALLDHEVVFGEAVLTEAAEKAIDAAESTWIIAGEEWADNAFKHDPSEGAEA